MTSKLYENAYHHIFNNLPKWKQLAIREDSDRNNWSGLLTEFVKNVISMAENHQITSNSKTVKSTKNKTNKKRKRNNTNNKYNF